MTSRRSLRVAAFACAAAVIGVACGGASGGDDAVGPSEPAATAAPAAPADAGDDDTGADSGAVVPAALQFTAPLVGGGEIVGDELAGKPTAFWFWSPT